MRTAKVLTVVGVLLLACCTVLAEPVSVYFSPANSSQAIGSSFKIGILADIPKNPGVVDFGFNLVWDQSKMQLNDVSGAGTPWDIFWDPTTPESITGFLFPTPTSPESEYGSAFLLATLDFQCLQEGTSILGIAVDPDSLLQGFYGPDGTALDFSVTEGSVTQRVPEPGSVLLLAPTLFGLAFWRKRK